MFNVLTVYMLYIISQRQCLVTIIDAHMTVKQALYIRHHFQNILDHTSSKIIIDIMFMYKNA